MATDIAPVNVDQPGPVVSYEYALEYGKDKLEMQAGLLTKDDNVLIGVQLAQLCIPVCVPAVSDDAARLAFVVCTLVSH